MTANRREFLKKSAQTAGAAAAVALLPGLIRKTLAIEADSVSGSINDVKHIVVFMQENRSFDHYLGHLSGVRGYNDRFPVTLPSGLPVWFQSRPDDPGTTLLPFRYDTGNPNVNAQCIAGLPHSWTTTHAALNGGRADCWTKQKTNLTMGYHTRDDIPYHYALADAFTVCDQYFCSMPGNTHPNRMYLMTGMVDPTGSGGGPLMDNVDYITNQFNKQQMTPFSWTTYPERLEAAGVSWQIYQQGTTFDEYTGNYGTNVLAAFSNFVDAPSGSSLHKRAMTARTIAQLKQDVQADRLPQVSWLLPPAAYSEHPKYTPLYGAAYIAGVLDALTSNPQVWSNTALFIMYDENDGLFDHIVPPQPPTVPGSGKSTVDVDMERHSLVNRFQVGTYTADDLPYGLGPRVPMIVVSPWTKGGFVCSQVFDHTSVLQFIEKRFGVAETNITPWRRAICGDLTSAFNFSKIDAHMPTLPDTRGYIAAADEQCRRSVLQNAPAPDAAATLLPQEPGTRPARALPYELHVDGRIEQSNSVLAVTFSNRGKQGAHFWAYFNDTSVAPRSYTVEAGKQLVDTWPLQADIPYQLSVYGVNGFFRRFSGIGDRNGAEVTTRYDISNGTVHLIVTLKNNGKAPLRLTVSDHAYGTGTRAYELAPGARRNDRWNLSGQFNWYDLIVSEKDSENFQQRIAGHVENGQPSITDPAATAPTLTAI